MKKFLIGLAVLVAALAVAAPALADGQWKRFENRAALCSVSKPGGSRGATCIIKTGRLEDWSFIIYVGGIEVNRPGGTKVFGKSTTDDHAGSGLPYPGWQHQNEGVACRSMRYTVACMIRRGAMEGWSILIADDLIEVQNLDGVTKFKRGVA